MVDIRAGVIGCEHMFNEQRGKSSTHDSIMERARKNPEEFLKSVQAQKEQ